jgi:hypothetical protein
LEERVEEKCRLAVRRIKMHKSWERTAIKTATENLGGFSFEKPVGLHMDGSNFVAV